MKIASNSLCWRMSEIPSSVPSNPSHWSEREARAMFVARTSFEITENWWSSFKVLDTKQISKDLANKLSILHLVFFGVQGVLQHMRGIDVSHRCKILGLLPINECTVATRWHAIAVVFLGFVVVISFCLLLHRRSISRQCSFIFAFRPFLLPKRGRVHKVKNSERSEIPAHEMHECRRENYDSNQRKK